MAQRNIKGKKYLFAVSFPRNFSPSVRTKHQPEVIVPDYFYILNRRISQGLEIHCKNWLLIPFVLYMNHPTYIDHRAPKR